MIREQVTGKSFSGTLFFPNGEAQFSGVVVVPGSDGSVPESIAERVACQGYAVLALGYFGLEGLPQYLEQIHLEYFKNAIEWFKDRPEVRANSITILGYSRGGELALLLGSVFPKLLDGIIAYVPSSFVCAGFPYTNRPAWLLNNRPISPFLRGVMNREETLSEAEDLFFACEKGIIPYHKNTAEDPYHIVDLFLARQADQGMILVENIDCPLLVIAGEEDKIWPSSVYAKQIEDRLIQKGSTIERKFLIYPDAGHGIIAPYEGSIYHPVGKFWCTLGGTPEGNKLAHENAWKETFEFLKKL